MGAAAYRFQSLSLYGAVEPLTGQSFLLEWPALNSTLFQLFLEQVAATAPAPCHLLVLDTGAFHKAHSLRLPPNVGLLFRPPSAPELNPIERLWRDLKDWLAPRPPGPVPGERAARVGGRLKRAPLKTVGSCSNAPAGPYRQTWRRPEER